MNYLLKNNRRETGIRKPLIGMLTILIVAAFFYFFAPHFVNESLYRVAQPLWGARDYIKEKSASLISVFAYKERLMKENLSLLNKLAEADNTLLDLDEYKKENIELKKLLGRVSYEKRILAVVLAKPNRSLYDSLVIDVGEKDGVAVGDPVLSGGFIIGEVREVSTDNSKVTLNSAPGEISTVRVGDSGVDTEAFGRGGGNFLLKLPKEIFVQKGDLIKFAGIAPRFFGTVDHIERTEADTFQFILFKLPVNMYTLNWVEVVHRE
ncbi:MAG: rod shape-determining protein MreC [Patescibacteria group bacterium]